MEYIFKGLDMLISGIMMYILYPFLPKNIWIISEREDQAQDNGIAFFEYLNREQPQINTYYLLNKNCNEIKSVKKIGKVLIKGSFKHKIYFLKSKIVASTEKNIIEPWGSKIFYKKFSRFFPKKLKVFLQHGITDKDVSAVYGKQVSDIDIFVTTTEVEKNFIIDRFGYDEQEIANVGFCRYDKLVKNISITNKKNIILYIPTWRRYLFDLANNDSNYLEYAKKEFLKSDYYKTIEELINDEELDKVLKKAELKFIFVTHHGINALSDTFYTKSKNIEIYKSEDVKISDLLVKSKIFITDYSSIHFDSAYIGNKNIYYQFDKEKFFKDHAGKSYFSYENDGFGPVIEDKYNLIKKIEEISNIKVNSIEYKKYIDRRDKFFEFNDGDNCHRLYQFIMRKL